MDADQPVNKDSPDIFVDFSLTLHVEAVWLGVMLLSLHIALDVSTVFAHVVDIRKRCLVDLVDVRNNIAFYPLVVHSEFRLKANFW